MTNNSLVKGDGVAVQPGGDFLFILYTDYQKDEIFFTIRDFYFVFDNVSDNLLQVIFWVVMAKMYNCWTQNSKVVPNREN